MKLGVNRLVCIICGAIACIGTVCVLLTPLQVKSSAEWVNLTLKEAYFSSDGTIVPVICFAGLFAGGICAVMFGLNQDKVLGFVAMGILLVSAILLFYTESIYLASKAIDKDVALSNLSKSIKESKSLMKIGIGPLIGGLCGLIGGLSIPTVIYVFED